MNKPRYLSLAFIIVLVLMFAAARPYAVFADDETPPTPEPTEEAVEPTPTEEPTTASDEETPSPAEIIEQLPEGTDLVVLNESGEVLSLVTEEAAEVLAVPDPYFTVSSTLYTFTTADCDPVTALAQPCTNPIQASINFLNGTTASSPWFGTGAVPDDGFGNHNIYVEDGTFTEDVTVNGGIWTTTPTSLGLIGAGSGSTILDGYISIANMNAFTLSGFSVVDIAGPVNPSYIFVNTNSGTVLISDVDVTNAGGQGIEVSNHSGDISLINVDSSSNGSTGAYLDNTAGTGTVYVDSSNFSSNGGDGLDVTSNGNITFTDSFANDNDLDGVSLSNSGSGTGTIYVASTGFSDNGQGGVSGEGLHATSNRSITLSGVDASYNFSKGAFLNNSGVAGYPVSIVSSYFDWNGGSAGLQILSAGNVTLTDVEAFYNTGGGGTIIQNNFSTGYDVTIRTDFWDYSYFDNNAGNGLHILSAGDVSLSNVDASGNTAGNGAFIQNNFSTGYDVTIDPSYFDGNSGNGLYILSAGDVSLTDVDASYNTGGNGAYIQNNSSTGYDVTIGASFWDYSYFDVNSGNGLYILSAGDVSLSDVDASGNTGGNGAYIQNNFSTGYDVTIDPSYFDGNSGNGLYILSAGDVSLTDVDASDNTGGNGAYIQNNFSTGYDVTIGASFWDYSYFDVNSGHGLYILSAGDVTLSDVDASGNTGGHGAYIQNNFSTGYDVTIDPSYFDGNAGNGLYILSAGDVSLSDVEANDNDGPGLVATSSSGDITISCSQFMNNGDYGIRANLPGTLTLNGVTLNGNALGDDPYVTGGGTLVIGAGECDPSKKALPLFPSLPLNEVQVTGGEGIELNCSSFRGTVLILPNGDSALFPCPLNDTASLSSLGADALPGDLPDGNTFGSAFTAGVEKDGSAVSTLDSSITLSFVIPDGMGDSLAILFWDGSSWVEVAGGHSTGDGRFEAGTNHTGTFVLVSK